ncbi:hypothetical protein K431DRAFT_69528 [Polychaeton citri CBS 116435]|uniref:Uncharacterized protein n=1 Tax=Polychaeton citri CBS 116435 TaxID=1314669 RepID=A0A9P4Q6P8_9PEZI|nr:hypothetical protein K431DRAFT_69528 [Polychaeton citri CBS 116435]
MQKQVGNQEVPERAHQDRSRTTQSVVSVCRKQLECCKRRNHPCPSAGGGKVAYHETQGFKRVLDYLNAVVAGREGSRRRPCTSGRPCYLAPSLVSLSPRLSLSLSICQSLVAFIFIITHYLGS